MLLRDMRFSLSMKKLTSGSDFMYGAWGGDRLPVEWHVYKVTRF